MKHLSLSLSLSLFLLLSGELSAQELPEAVRYDTLYKQSDSVLVITTACAPICSSIVEVYSAAGTLRGRIESPWPQAVFPEAYIEDSILRWRDNTPLLLDEEEKSHLKTKH